MDLLNKRFGKLLVIGLSERKGYVLCRCDCKNEKEIRATNLTKQKEPTRSCGCDQKKKAREIGTKTIAGNSKKRIETDMKFNTNFGVIENSVLPKNNKSGHKGVWYNPQRGLYETFITVHSKRIFLGRFASIEKAIEEREKAELKYFTPLISEKQKETQKGRS